MDFSLMIDRLPDLIAGIPKTLGLVAFSLLIGGIGAIGLATMRMSANPMLSGLSYSYVFVFRGTPLLVQIFLIYYGIGQFEAVRESFAWSVLRDAYWCAVIALAMNTAAYTSEIIRGGIQSVPHGGVEAARACGMSTLMTYRRIILPGAFRQALPAYGNEVILMVKASALASTVTIMEITGIARGIVSQTFAPFEIFIVAGAIYLAINFLATRAIKYAEWRLTPYLRKRPAAAPTDSVR